MKTKIGIFGGTFSPPHNTHVEMAVNSVNQLGLDKLFVLPNAIPPHKESSCGAFDRLNMTRLAFAGLNDKIVVDDYEIEQGGSSYTFLTLEHYRSIYPDAEFYLVIGGDSLRDFDKWKNPQEIANNAILAVCARKGIDFCGNEERIQKEYGARIVRVELEQTDLSSTLIRVDYQFGKDCSACVPPQINEYVLSRCLYSQFHPMVNQVKALLTYKRFKHTYYVVRAGVRLDSGLPFDKVFVACLLHDCAKYFTQDEWSKYGFVNDEDYPEKVIHAPLGALVAQKDFGIEDKEILDAIKYHSTARPNMTKLDMVVYVADKIEESRPYPTSQLYGNTMVETFLNCMREANKKRESYGVKIHPLTNQALEYYSALKETTINDK